MALIDKQAYWSLIVDQARQQNFAYSLTARGSSFAIAECGLDLPLNLLSLTIHNSFIAHLVLLPNSIFLHFFREPTLTCIAQIMGSSMHYVVMRLGQLVNKY